MCRCGNDVFSVSLRCRRTASSVRSSFSACKTASVGGQARRAQFILIMGCASSRTVAVSARRQTWNEKYAELSHEASNYSMLRSRSDLEPGEESTTSKILKQGNTVRSVNGYSFGGSLGKGAFGEVFTATKGKDRYAIKVLRRLL